MPALPYQAMSDLIRGWETLDHRWPAPAPPPCTRRTEPRATRRSRARSLVAAGPGERRGGAAPRSPRPAPPNSARQNAARRSAIPEPRALPRPIPAAGRRSARSAAPRPRAALAHVGQNRPLPAASAAALTAFLPAGPDERPRGSALRCPQRAPPTPVAPKRGRAASAADSRAGRASARASPMLLGGAALTPRRDTI